MNPLRSVTLWWASHRSEAAVQPPPAASPSELQTFGELLGERLRLGTEIADQAARRDIESYTTTELLGTRTWYDIESWRPVFDREECGVERAVRYLELRGHLVRHPVQQHLVRFSR